MKHISVRTPTPGDILHEGSMAIRGGELGSYQVKLKNGGRSFKWILFRCYDEKRAQKIVNMVEKRLVSKGLNVVKACVAKCEDRGAPIDKVAYGVRIHISDL